MGKIGQRVGPLVLKNRWSTGFLAKNWKKYSEEKLSSFVNRFYKSLDDNFEMLTLKTQNMLPYMKQGNWLYNYQFIEEIERVLFQMDRRTKHQSDMGHSIKELKEFYVEFEQEFTLFFEELRTFASDKLKTL